MKKPGSSAAIAIQVKTRTPAYRYAWRANAHDGPDDANFYVFVDLGSIEETPQFWIVPAREVELVRRNGQVPTKAIERFKGAWSQLEVVLASGP